MNETGNVESGSFASEFTKLMGAQMSDLKPGKIVPGRIVAINKDMVTVDIGFKSEGVVPTVQFPVIDGKISAKIGETVEVCILALENQQGQVVLSKEKADQLRVWFHVEDVFKTDGIISGNVIQKVKGGLQVDIGIPAFLPGSQIDIRPHRNLDKFIGEKFDFKVLKITKDKGNIVLSRRAVLMNEREMLRGETLKVLQEGVVMEGIVKNVTDYGAFIDLGGIDGLLHITDISWGKINHPSEKLTVGESVPVVVLKYDNEKERVSLGMKQLKEDPWQKVHERYPAGSNVTGKVTSLADYGAFIELEEGVEGLVHVSEMSWTKKVRNPSKICSVGDRVEAVVLGIDSEARRISLGLKQLTPNPWESLAQRHPIGSRVKGQVKSITEFGIFVGVEDGIDGLVHVSDFSWTKRIKDPKEINDLFKKGDEVEAVVLDIDIANERLSLGVKQITQDPWETVVQRYPVGSRVKGTMSSLADFGIFVQIEEGIDGLIHNSQLNLERDQRSTDLFAEGKSVEAEVVNVDREERRISLSLKALRTREERGDQGDFIEDSSMGVTFKDLLDQAQKK